MANTSYSIYDIFVEFPWVPTASNIDEDKFYVQAENPIGIGLLLSSFDEKRIWLLSK